MSVLTFINKSTTNNKFHTEYPSPGTNVAFLFFAEKTFVLRKDRIQPFLASAKQILRQKPFRATWPPQGIATATRTTNK